MLMTEIDDTLKEIANQSPIHRAAYWGYDDAIADLIAEGVDPDEPDAQGETPLHKAVRLGNDAAIEMLMDKGADVNAANGMGLTALHWAALTGREAVAEFLLDKGADVHAREYVLGGLTALDFARIMHYGDLAELLETHMAIF
jgi:ankyrin repeat protein